MRRGAGFTLLELLAVIGVIGILVAVAVPGYARFVATAAVAQAAQTFAQDVNRARSGAKRANACQELALSGASSYTVTSYAADDCGGGFVTRRAVTLPPRTSIALTLGGPSTLKFYPPHGTVQATARQFRVSSTAVADVTQDVRVTGVFGRAVLK